MDNDAILLNKVIKCEQPDNFLYQCYLDTNKKLYDTENFNNLINDLKILCEMQYDFSLLSSESKKFNVNRRDYKAMCEMICVLIGDAIKDICNHSREPIITSPTNFEDYCHFKSAELVLYGNSNLEDSIITYDGKKYKVVDSQVEQTPYYMIYCNLLELL